MTTQRTAEAVLTYLIGQLEGHASATEASAKRTTDTWMRVHTQGRAGGLQEAATLLRVERDHYLASQPPPQEV